MQDSAGFGWIRVDEKITQSVVERYRVGFDPGDPGSGRPLPKPGDKPVDRILAPLGKYDNGSLRGVVDPAGEIE